MTISNAFRRAALGLLSDEVAIVLLTISGEGFETFYVCNNDEAITSNGQEFVAYPFGIQLPGDGEGAPVARLQISNVSHLIGDAVDSATGDVTIRIDLILASDPNTMEKTFLGLELRNCTRSGLIVEGEIQAAQFVSEPYPFMRVIPSRFPGMFF